MRLIKITEVNDIVSCINVDYIVEIKDGIRNDKNCTVITMLNDSLYYINDPVEDIYELLKQHGISK